MPDIAEQIEEDPMHGARELSWKSALLTGWLVGLAASAIAQSPRPSQDERPPATLDARLSELEGWLARAYFSEVESAARDLRSSASLAASSPQTRARLEVIAGTAHLALGAASASISCFRRAVEAWPELELQARSTSPKVLRALAIARSELRAARDLPPRLIDGPPPTGPSSSRGLRPTILCRLLIDADGAVVEATVQRPRADLEPFERIALATVRSYRFAPARSDGQPVSSWLNWPVRF